MCMKEHHSHFCYTELGTIDTKYHLLIFLQMTMVMTKKVLWTSYDYTERLTADTYHLLILSDGRPSPPPPPPQSR